MPGTCRIRVEAVEVKALDYILGDWQISGITSFISGTPITPGMALSDGADLTGSSEGARDHDRCGSVSSEERANVRRNFNTEAFARTAQEQLRKRRGRDSASTRASTTGTSAFPNASVIDEDKYFQFRTELFNAWNHTQFSGIDTTPRFDAAGEQINANFGAFTGARDPRRIQLSLRVMF